MRRTTIWTGVVAVAFVVALLTMQRNDRPGTHPARSTAPASTSKSLENSANATTPQGNSVAKSPFVERPTASGTPTSVSGVVVTASNEPIAGARVSIAAAQGASRPRYWSETTDANGAFAVTDKLGAFAIEITASASGFGKRGVGPLTPGRDSLENVVIVLHPEAKLSGTVVNEDGGRLSGVLVSAVMAEPVWNAVPSIESGTDGTFTLGGLSSGTWQLRASHPQDSLAQFDGPAVAMSDGEHVRDVLLVCKGLRDLTITGRVTDPHGAPLDGAMVSANSGRVSPATTSGADGQYVLRDLIEGEYAVAVERDGYVSATKQNVVAGTSDVDFVLEIPAVLTGQVVDATTGKPVTGFELGWEFSASWQSRGSAGRSEEISSPDGTFSIPLHYEGEVHLTVKSPGYAVWHELVHNDTAQPVVARLDAVKPVRGVVVSETGQPVENAGIFSRVVSDDARSREFWLATSDAAGAFEITSRNTRLFRLYAFHSRYGSGTVEFEDPYHPPEDVRIELSTKTECLGEVRLNSKLVQEGTVVARSAVDGTEYAGVIGPAGRYSIQGLPAGAYTIEARVRTDKPVIKGNRFDLELRPGEIRRRSFDLRTGTGVIQGRVTNNGAPVNECNVTAFIDEPGQTELIRLGGSITNGDGTYAIENLETGPYLIQAKINIGGTSYRYRWMQVELATDRLEAPDIDVGGGGSVRCDVRAVSADHSGLVALFEASHAPAGDIAFDWQSAIYNGLARGTAAHVRYGHTQTEVVFNNVPAGEYVVVAMLDGVDTGDPQYVPVVSTAVEVTEGEIAEVAFQNPG